MSALPTFSFGLSSLSLLLLTFVSASAFAQEAPTSETSDSTSSASGAEVDSAAADGAGEGSAEATSAEQGSQLPSSSSAPSTAEEREDDEGPGFGVYLDATGALMFSTQSTHEWNDSCPSINAGSGAGSISWNPDCEASAPIGVLADARLGLRFGYLGVEFMGLFAGDWSQAKFDEALPGVPDVASSMQVGRVGGGVGGAFRLMTKPGLFRVSGAAGGGAMFRHVYTSFSSLDGSNEFYVAPYVIGDLTITLLGFINLGVVAMVEFDQDVYVTPDFEEVAGPAADELDNELGRVRVFSGPQFFIGPRLGLHFGG